MADIEDKVDRLVTDVAEIKTCLKGYNGKGLVECFDEHCAQDVEFKKEYYNFKRWVVGVAVTILLSGGLGVGGLQLLELLK